MRLSVKALSITCALLWAGCVLLVSLANLAFPPYGMHFLQGVSSVYPGFHASRMMIDVLIGTGYALVDGAVGGIIVAVLYNALAHS